MNDLTKQYQKGELPDDRLYYYRFKGEPDVQITTQYGLYCEEADNKKEIEVIDFVPSYSEYLALQSDSLAKNEGVEINAELEAENAQLKKWCEEFNALDVAKENEKLKELLKECRDGIEKHIPKKWHGEKDETMQKYRNKRELRTKIDEGMKFYEVEFCTGLKDKNGKLIYEGDIVKGKATIGEGNFEYLGCIKWYYQSELIGCYVEDKDGGAWELKQIHAKISADNITGEVIGNIHENADLLENNND